MELRRGQNPLKTKSDFRLNKLYNLKIRTKLIIIFILIVFLPVFFVGIFLTAKMKDMALSQSFKEADNEVARIVNEVGNLIEFNATLQNTILTDVRLQTIVQRRYISSFEIFEAYNAYKVIEEYERLYQEIADIRVYVENDSLLDNMDIMGVTDEVRDSWWYQQSQLWFGKVISSYYIDDIKKKDYFMLCKSIELPNKSTMVIMTLIDLEYIFRFIQTERLNIQILDAKSMILASTQPDDRGKNLNDVAGLYVVPRENTWEAEYLGKKSQLFLENVEKSYMVLPVFVLSSVPLKTILQPANDASRFGFILITLSLATTAGFIILFSELMTRKISQISNDMNLVAQGKFDEVHVYTEGDEIGSLSKNLYEMSHNLSKLMHENLQIKEKEKELLIATEQMKFEVLKSQVNPHFLFNILESLRMKAHINGDGEIANGIKILGQLMRRSLETTHDLVSVSEEIDFVRRYIELQKFRFGDRLGYTIEVEEVVSSYLILPLLIQPIVENAIIHGIERCKEQGLLSISVQERDKLYITIKDNGKGMDMNSLNALRLSLNLSDPIESDFSGGTVNEKERKHIGVKNIYGRIINLYGNEGELCIHSSVDEPNRGTEVIIKIPLSRLPKKGDIDESTTSR